MLYGINIKREKMMKRILASLVVMFMLTGCATNNGWFNWMPGISPDHAASPCDQTRADVCKQFGGEDGIKKAMDALSYGLIGMILADKMTPQEAIDLVKEAQALILANKLNSGQVWSKLVKGKDAKVMALLAYKMGFNPLVGMNSTFLFDEESAGVINQYLDNIVFELNMLASVEGTPDKILVFAAGEEMKTVYPLNDNGVIAI